MAGALPIIGPAFGVVSTVVGLNQQQQQIRNQNNAIAQQMAASAEAERIRRQDIQVQQEIAFNQYMLENEQRRLQFNQGFQELRQAFQQNELQNTMNTAVADARNTSAVSGLLEARSQIPGMEQQKNAQGQEQVYGSLQAQASTENVAPGVRQAGQEFSAAKASQMARANMLAGGVDRSKSTQAAGEAQELQFISDSLRALQGSAIQDKAAATAVLQSEQFQKALAAITGMEGDQLRQLVDNEIRAMASDYNFSTATDAAAYQSNLAQLQSRLQGLPLDLGAVQNQADLNAYLANQALRSTSGAIASAGAAERAALSSQRSSGSGLFSSLAQIGASSIPLIQAIDQAQNYQSPLISKKATGYSAGGWTGSMFPSTTSATPTPTSAGGYIGSGFSSSTQSMKK